MLDDAKWVLDGEGRLAEDARCVRCRYNLRGLNPLGVCPECGQAVRNSWFEHARSRDRPIVAFAVWMATSSAVCVFLLFVLAPVQETALFLVFPAVVLAVFGLITASVSLLQWRRLRRREIVIGLAALIGSAGILGLMATVWYGLSQI